MAQVDRQVRTILEETRFVVALNGSILFTLNALVPLYPLGRQVIVRGGLPGEGRRFTAAQIEAVIVVVALGAAALFLPLYVRLLMKALQALEGGEGS